METFNKIKTDELSGSKSTVYDLYKEDNSRELGMKTCSYSKHIDCPYSERDCENCTIKQRINRKRK